MACWRQPSTTQDHEGANRPAPGGSCTDGMGEDAIKERRRPTRSRGPILANSIMTTLSEWEDSAKLAAPRPAPVGEVVGELVGDFWGDRLLGA